MSTIKEGQVKTYTTTDGEVYYNKIEAEFNQAKIEIKKEFDIVDFEYDGLSNLDVRDIATLIKVSAILKKYNQI